METNVTHKVQWFGVSAASLFDIYSENAWKHRAYPQLWTTKGVQQWSGNSLVKIIPCKYWENNVKRGIIKHNDECWGKHSYGWGLLRSRTVVPSICADFAKTHWGSGEKKTLENSTWLLFISQSNSDELPWNHLTEWCKRLGLNKLIDWMINLLELQIPPLRIYGRIYPPKSSSSECRKFLDSVTSPLQHEAATSQKAKF